MSVMPLLKCLDSGAYTHANTHAHARAHTTFVRHLSARSRSQTWHKYDTWQGTRVSQRKREKLEMTRRKKRMNMTSEYHAMEPPILIYLWSSSRYESLHSLSYTNIRCARKHNAVRANLFPSLGGGTLRDDAVRASEQKQWETFSCFFSGFFFSFFDSLTLSR